MKFEYAILYMIDPSIVLTSLGGQRLGSLAEALNSYGSEGWELISIIDHLIVLKRQIVPRYLPNVGVDKLPPTHVTKYRGQLRGQTFGFERNR